MGSQYQSNPVMAMQQMQESICYGRSLIMSETHCETAIIDFFEENVAVMQCWLLLILLEGLLSAGLIAGYVAMR